MRSVLFLLTFFLFSFAAAHPANVASSQIKFAADGSFVAMIRFDLAAFATGSTPKDANDDAMNAFLEASDEALKKTLADAEARFRAGFVTEPGASLDRLEFPAVADVRRYLAEDPKPKVPMMMMIATVRGHLPKEARAVAFQYPALLDTVIQTVEIPYTEPLSEPVEADRRSSTIAIPTEAEIKRLSAAMDAPPSLPSPIPSKPRKTTPAAKKESASPSAEIPKPPVEAPVPTIEAERPPAKKAPVLVPTQPQVKQPETLSEVEPTAAPTPTPRPSPVLTYLRMGFLHILPQGPDHILFVLGLFLLGSNTKALLKQVTAFTVAHSITLALATLDLVRLPGRVVEPLIAASIAFVAIENLYLRDVKPWRTAVVFLFGLVHGIGFAEVFANAGLRGRGLVEALLSFNVGVEMGQLTVIALAFAAVGWFRRDPRYRQYVVVPASVAIAATALFWTVQRAIG